MSFKHIIPSIIHVTKKYKLSHQAMSSLLCKRAKKVIQCHFGEEKTLVWNPQKFVKGVLTIAVPDSSEAGNLFLQREGLLEKLNREDLPHKVDKITIQTTPPPKEERY